MAEEGRKVTFSGAPATLVGRAVKPGDHAPDFTVVTTDANEHHLHTTRGKVRIISVVPSVDTGTCTIQTRRFEQEAAKLPDAVAVLTISMDLPYAQKRWKSEQGASRVVFLSDHREASFGTAYGTLMIENRLLGRSVFVIGSDDVVRYAEYVSDAGKLPDFDQVLHAVHEALE